MKVPMSRSTQGLLLVSIPLLLQLLFSGVLIYLESNHPAGQRWVPSVLVAGIAGSGLVTALFSHLLYRRINQRVEVLEEHASRLAEAAQRERELRESLERSAAEQTAANRDLLQRQRENEKFVFTVAHDLRSPLVNLQGFSKELALSCADLRTLLQDNSLPAHIQQRAVALLDGDIADSVRFIFTSAARLSLIIDALLRLSRAGRVEYQWQEVNVYEIVQRVKEALRDTAQKRGVTVIVNDLPPVWGDPTALEQVFANLIGNALNYLSAERPGRVEVGVRDSAGNTPEGFVTYYIRDNGLGIAEAHLPRLFRAFQRLHADRAEGEGMGLTIVRSIVERHQGKVWAESKVGEGSTFYVALPLRAEKPQPGTSP